LTRNLALALAWLAMAMMNNIQWQRYKEQSIIKDMLDKSTEQDTEGHSKPSVQTLGKE